MDERLSLFLRYDYGEAQDIAKTLLAASGIALTAGIAFADKFLKLGDSTSPQVRKIGLTGLYLLGIMAFIAGMAMIMNYAEMVRLIEHCQAQPDKVVQWVAAARRNLRTMQILLYCSVAVLGGGIFCLLYVARDLRPRRKRRWHKGG